MASLSSLVTSTDVIKYGEGIPIPSQRVRVAQMALSAAGYKMGTDGVYDGQFGAGTQLQVKRFQTQHGLTSDGEIGQQTAAELDKPPQVLVEKAIPLIHAASGLPHDDTASLIAFYGNPDSAGFDRNLVDVMPPFPLTYEGKAWPHPMKIHRLCAPAFTGALTRMWDAAGHDPKSPILRRVSAFSGTYNNRPIRGSARKSTHAFGAGWDFDAEHLALGHHVDAAAMPIEVIQAVEAENLFWGGKFVTRPDPMHVQAAHEG